MSVKAARARYAASAPAPTTTTYSDSFTGTTGAAPAAAWSKAKNGSTPYPAQGATIQSNAMRIVSGSTAAWSGGASIFYGDPNTPQGNTGSGIPPIAANWDYTFRYTLANLLEHYPSIMLRGRGADLWPSGGGQNLFQTGTSLVLGPSANSLDIVTGYNTETVATVPVTFPSADMWWRILVQGTRLAFKVWAASAGVSGEPGGVGSDASWTYDNATILSDQSDGSIGFSVFNGPAAAQKTVTIDDFVAKTPILALGSSRTTPPADPAGFTRIWTEQWVTDAAAGTSAGQFMDVYSNSFQPYDDGGTIGAGAMYPRQMISAHDGVMDVSSDGLRASAGTFGPTATAFNRIGGRFAIRMKCIGMFNNGPAFMIWPSSEVWAEGELDFPESVSGRGGLIGFQDAPWIHHHRMTAGQEQYAQDVPLNVSWRDWHVYSAEWYPPGSSKGGSTGLVIYFVDEVEVYRTTTDVPTTAHRWCFQIGDWGTAGNLYIDWAAMSSLN